MSRTLGRTPGALLFALALIVSVLFHPGLEARAEETREGDRAGQTLEPGDYDPLFDDDLGFSDDFAARDPFEGMNRFTLNLNERIDWLIFDPVTKLYRLAVPEPARDGIHRVFINLNSPAIIVNKLLQMRFEEAAKALGRFTVNTTAGFGGLFDAAKEAGWVHSHADFGQTLALWGTPSGPYLVIPLFGPSTLRDGFGDVVDQFMNPVTYFIGPTPQLFAGAGYGFSRREASIDTVHALRDSSIDYYAVLRSAYLQDRDAQLQFDR